MYCMYCMPGRYVTDIYILDSHVHSDATKPIPGNNEIEWTEGTVDNHVILT
jgi:hypothetical protein